MSVIDFYTKKGIRLGEFNKKWLEHIDKSKISIILNSEETESSRSYALYLAYWISKKENRDKTIYVSSYNYYKSLEVKKELEDISKRLFLKITTNNEKYMIYDNGIKIKFLKIHINVYINEPVDFAICIDTAEIQNNTFLKFYKDMSPNLERNPNTMWIISSYPCGYNLFYKLLTDAENGKNIFKPLRIYYWEDNKKDGKWVSDKISMFGEEEFNRRYNLIFSKNKRKSIKKQNDDN